MVDLPIGGKIPISVAHMSAQEGPFPVERQPCHLPGWSADRPIGARSRIAGAATAATDVSFAYVERRAIVGFVFPAAHCTLVDVKSHVESLACCRHCGGPEIDAVLHEASAWASVRE